jgi:hypothetical protein
LSEQAASHVGRWFVGHVLSAVGFGLCGLAAMAIHGFLRRKGSSTSSLPPLLLSVGAGLHAAGLGADGVGPIILQAAGERARLFFDASGMWISGLFMAGAVVLAFGMIGQVVLLLRAGILKGPLRTLVPFGAVLFILGEPIPSGWGLYVIAAGGLMLYIPVAIAIWREA